MTKNEALRKFGEKRVDQIRRMAEMLNIKREAIYQWGDEIPELRAYQIEKFEREGLLPVSAERLNQTALDPS
ncbi:Cro/CI family transcriptional regulator [Aeromonas enteropelogenes]|uniref:Cro/CI family transcriptional regulator n=1 Tax=Aeromonas enteropelogenes TaxID=29489 RepID=UPI003BA22D89